jgi:hypothetical protein
LNPRSKTVAWPDEPRIEVVWCDHWRTPEATKAADMDDSQLMTSVGYVVRETDDVLTVAQTKITATPGHEAEYQHTTNIYKALIVAKRRLR